MGLYTYTISLLIEFPCVFLRNLLENGGVALEPIDLARFELKWRDGWPKPQNLENQI